MSIFQSAGQSLKFGIYELLSDNPYIKNHISPGLSIHLTFKINQFELTPFISAYSNNNENALCASCIDAREFEFSSASFGIQLNHKTEMTLKWNILIGVSGGYSQNHFSEWGRYAGVEYGSYNMDNLFFGGDLGLRYNRVFNLPVSLDFFISPVYTLNLRTIPKIQVTRFNENMFFLKPELGLIFVLEGLKKWAKNKN